MGGDLRIARRRRQIIVPSSTWMNGCRFRSPEDARKLSSTARYTQVATHTIRATQSPLDRLSLEVTPPR